MSLSEQRIDELDDLVYDCEIKIEVSDAEKVLSKLAYLMSLIIDKIDHTRPTLKELLGIEITSYNQLSSETIRRLEMLAEEFKIGRRPRLVFWMWRAWIFQKDLSVKKGASAGADDRDGLEWFSLSEEIRTHRSNLQTKVDGLEYELRFLLEEILKRPEETSYLMRCLNGSPLATLSAAMELLCDTAAAIDALKKSVSVVYGFGGNRRPNKRFDRQSARDIKAFFLSKHDPDNPEFIEPWLSSARTRSQAKNAASKAVSRFADVLAEYDNYLERCEEKRVPEAFYVRRLIP